LVLHGEVPGGQAEIYWISSTWLASQVQANGEVSFSGKKYLRLDPQNVSLYGLKMAEYPATELSLGPIGLSAGSDWNGDGYLDVAMANNDGVIGSPSFLVSGSQVANWPSSPVSLQNSMLYTWQNQQWKGESVVAGGDFNGDALGDGLIGYPYRAGVPSCTSALSNTQANGEIYLFLGETGFFQ
jgi:hypothetical protein